MTCTLVGLLKIKDTDAFETYRSGVPATLEPYQGRVLTRGAASGRFADQVNIPDIDGVALIQFPNQALAEAWAEGPEYQALLPVRSQAIDLTLMAFDT